MATTPGGGDWDWDRAKDLAERWFRPLADREGWLALGYLFAGAVISPFLFAAMMAASAVTFALVFIFVGIFLIVLGNLIVLTRKSLLQRRAPQG